jgi:hypothetical protein
MWMRLPRVHESVEYDEALSTIKKTAITAEEEEVKSTVQTRIKDPLLTALAAVSL